MGTLIRWNLISRLKFNYYSLGSICGRCSCAAGDLYLLLNPWGKFQLSAFSMLYSHVICHCKSGSKWLKNKIKLCAVVPVIYWKNAQTWYFITIPLESESWGKCCPPPTSSTYLKEIIWHLLVCHLSLEQLCQGLGISWCDDPSHNSHASKHSKASTHALSPLSGSDKLRRQLNITNLTHFGGEVWSSVSCFKFSAASFFPFNLLRFPSLLKR